MKCEKYNDLVENLKFKDSKEFMDVLNKRMDKAVSESGDPVLYYEELICYLKKDECLSEAYTLLSIGYAIFIGIIATFINEFGNICLLLAIILFIVIALLALDSSKKGLQRGFVLNLLMMRYEKLNDKK